MLTKANFLLHPILARYICCIDQMHEKVGYSLTGGEQTTNWESCTARREGGSKWINHVIATSHPPLFINTFHTENFLSSEVKCEHDFISGSTQIDLSKTLQTHNHWRSQDEINMPLNLSVFAVPSEFFFCGHLVKIGDFYELNWPNHTASTHPLIRTLSTVPVQN